MMLIDKHISASRMLPPDERIWYTDAIIEYTERGAEPDGFPSAAHRALWAVTKEDIDNVKAVSEKRTRAGSIGGSKPKQKQAKASKSKQSEASSSKGKLKENEKENINEKEREEYQDLGAREAPLPFPTMRGAVYFDPPSAEDVDSYAKANCLPPFDARSFVDYYEAQGWVMGNGQPMRDWKAAARKWGSGQWRFRADEQKRKEAQDADYDRFECVWDDQQQDQV